MLFVTSTMVSEPVKEAIRSAGTRERALEHLKEMLRHVTFDEHRRVMAGRPAEEDRSKEFLMVRFGVRELIDELYPPVPAN